MKNNRDRFAEYFNTLMGIPPEGDDQADTPGDESGGSPEDNPEPRDNRKLFEDWINSAHERKGFGNR